MYTHLTRVTRSNLLEPIPLFRMLIRPKLMLVFILCTAHLITNLESTNPVIPPNPANPPNPVNPPTTAKQIANLPSELDEYGGIGLIQDVGTVQLKKSVTNAIVGVKAKVNRQFREQADVIKSLALKLTTLRNIPALQTVDHWDKVKNTYSFYQQLLDQIEKSLRDISRYGEETVDLETVHECLLEYSEIGLDYMNYFKKRVEGLIGQVNTQLTAAQVTADPEKFEKLSTSFFLIKDVIEQTRDEIFERLLIMDTLSLDMIPERLPFDLETLSCLTAGDLEDMTINYCKEFKEGLFCEISINSYTVVQQYNRYLPVNYKGTQISFQHPNQVLLKSVIGSWELMTCEEEFDNDYDQVEHLVDLMDCTTVPYNNPCIDEIFSTEFDIILKECNFTTQINSPPIARTPLGILIMSDQISVKELSRKDKTVKAQFSKKVPYHVITNDLLKLQIGEKELTLKPYYRARERKIHFTYLTNDFIDKMINKASIRDTLNRIKIDHILYLIFGIILVILTLTVMCLCCNQTKVSNCFKRWRESRARKLLNQANQTANNLKENAKFLNNKEKGVELKQFF